MFNNHETTTFSLALTGIDAKKLALLALPLTAFLIPLVFAGPQIVIGSLINCYLFLSTQLYPKKQWLVLAALPSIAALSHGYLFGPATPFLIYFLPFIWLGNLVLMWSFDKWQKTVTVPGSMFMAALLKSALLFVIANIYVKLALVPAIFLTAMGVFQLATAMIGGAFAYLVLTTNKRFIR